MFPHTYINTQFYGIYHAGPHASATSQWQLEQIGVHTLALKPVSNRFTFKPVWPNHIMWFTESGFQSVLGALTQLP